MKQWRIQIKYKSVLPNPTRMFVDYKGPQYVDLTLNRYNIMQIDRHGTAKGCAM